MKKTLAILTLLAVSMISVSAHAACGSNTSRNAPTRAPGAPATTGTGTTNAAAGAGMPR